jgi:hypothetical protein
MPDWESIIVTVLGSGTASALITHWLDRKQRYQVMTFEKRLQAHQEALSQCYELWDIVTGKRSDEDKDEGIKKVRNWWVNNQLFLDEASRSQILTLIDLAYDHIYDPKVRQSAFYAAWRETRKTIIRGIGSKYLPETTKDSKPDTQNQN